ncbi:MAG TPA: iron-sulfur cluster assembly accessory protein [Arenimonas sp.]|uniref:HesB/IscA family protein n=1 Tax=Arenimonas sp. TaxID=1872635 RepID=UPI002C250E3A|nr:iron-sulfur cluster assembly accessory protein [Arenimonas sp.]HMB56699.1 iron-sulfur cluster assembly accessory protein [Arenimonas sp.]
MAVTLTPPAVERVRQYLSETPGGIGLRFGVKKSGCSGWAYLIDIATSTREDEVVFEQDGVSVRVDQASLAQVDGTEIDFVSQGLNQQFVFRNPRVAAECGCGESFTTDEQAA